MRKIVLQKRRTISLTVSLTLSDGRYLSHILLDLQNSYSVVSSGSIATCIIIFMKHLMGKAIQMLRTFSSISYISDVMFLT